MFRKKQEASPYESFSNKTQTVSTLRLPCGEQNSGLKHFFQTYGKPHSKYSIPIVFLGNLIVRGAGTVLAFYQKLRLVKR